MRVIDLTHTVKENMPVYPGMEQPSLTEAASVEKNGYKETVLHMFSHTGTHIDAPAHIVAGKATLDSFNAVQFVGKALVIDCRSYQKGQRIGIDTVLSYGDKLKEAEFLLFNLGWDKYTSSGDRSLCRACRPQPLAR